MMFPPRFTRYVFSFIMSIYMVTIMTFIITLVNTGMDSDFLTRWWRAFYIAWPIAFVLIVLGSPHLQALAGKLIRKAPTG